MSEEESCIMDQEELITTDSNPVKLVASYPSSKQH